MKPEVPMTNTTVLPYPRVREAFGSHPVRAAEVPVEHAVSLPLPSLRWTVPGFAVFAGPAVRRPGQPPRLGTPDRWWVLDASRAGLVAYNLVTAAPFAADLPPGPVDVAPTVRSLAETREDLRVFDELLDAAVGDFFAGTAADAGLRRALLDTVTAVLPGGTQPWYEALTPDFFAWLKG
jgi:hypothetical protein